MLCVRANQAADSIYLSTVHTPHTLSTSLHLWWSCWLHWESLAFLSMGNSMVWEARKFQDYYLCLPNRINPVSKSFGMYVYRVEQLTDSRINIFLMRLRISFINTTI